MANRIFPTAIASPSTRLRAFFGLHRLRPQIRLDAAQPLHRIRPEPEAFQALQRLVVVDPVQGQGRGCPVETPDVNRKGEPTLILGHITDIIYIYNLFVYIYIYITTV